MVDLEANGGRQRKSEGGSSHIQQHPDQRLSRKRIMNNPILVASKKRKFEQLSCELNPLNSILLPEEQLPIRHSDEQKKPTGLLPSRDEFKISTSSDPVIVELDEEIEKRHCQIKICLRMKETMQVQNSLVKTQTSETLQRNKQIPVIRQPFVTLMDLQSSLMAREKTLELLSEFHKFNINEQEEEKSNGLIGSTMEINNSFFEKIEAILTNDNISEDKKVIQNIQANYELQKNSLKKLQPGKWLNDEIINAYTALLNQRSRKEAKKVYIFSTLFYSLLETQIKTDDISAVKLNRWLKKQKVELSQQKMLLIPINITHSHWLLACIDFTAKEFIIIDSMPCSRERATHIAKYLTIFLEICYKQSEDAIDFSKWPVNILNNVPQQGNSYDCGLCLCLNIEQASRFEDAKQIGYDFSNELSRDYRKRIAVELMFGKLLTQE